MRTLLTLVIVVLFSLSQGRAQSPTITVSGKVTDEKGVSVSGATVLEKNTRNATTTSDDGTFTLKVKPKAHIIVSYVGYEAYEIAAGTNLLISLAPDAKSLTDVVVTGVGTATTRKMVPIDVATVNSKDFAKSATISVEQALDGQIAGAVIQQTSGQPGAPFNITLRGINSLGSNNPLIMMDGVEIKDLTVIDPNSIDHIEVVKGAAAGMLYGAQGANGVIQIFSKKGALNGRLNVTFNTKASVDNIIKGPHPILSSFHHFVTDANNNILDQFGKPVQQNSIGIWTDPAPPDVTVATGNPNLQNTKTYNLQTYDHLKQAFREAGTFVNSVTVSGGSSYADFALTASQLNQQDVFSNNFSRTNISLGLGVQPFKGFSIRSNSQVMSRYENLLGGNRFDVLTAYNFIDFNWRDSTGHRALKNSAASNSLNSLSEQEWHQRNTQTVELFQNFDANYKFPRFVELDFKYGVDYSTESGFDYYLNQSAEVQPNQFWGINQDGSILNNYTRTYDQNLLSSIYLRTDFEKDFHLNVPIKTTTQFTYDYRSFVAKQYFAEGVQLPPYPPPSISAAVTKNAGDGNGLGGNAAQNLNEAITTFGSLFMQTIDFGTLVSISGGFRSDYGSAFGAASKPFTFPRGTILFRPSELMHLDWLEGWKLRAAYGKAGIQPGAYDRQTTLIPITDVGLSLPTRASNDSLALAVSTETEVGTDATLRLFSGSWLSHMILGATYWTRNTTNVYQDAQVAPSTGYSTRLDNLSTIQSNGVDLSLDLNVFHSANVTWNMGIRWATTQSKVTKVFDDLTQFDGIFAVKENAKVGLFYGEYVLHSLNQLEADGKTPYIPAASQGNYALVNGNVVNKASNVPFISNANDQRVIGQAYPDFTSSWINSINLFKTLTIGFQFDWVHGNSVYNLTKQWLYTPAGGSGGSGAISADYDKKINVGGNVGSFVAYYQALYNLVNPLDYFVENGSYIRLKDLSVTYDLTRLVHTNVIKHISATASGRNLLTFTKYTGMDPENTSGYGTQGNLITGDGVGATTGVDFFGVPNLRSYQISLNVGF